MSVADVFNVVWRLDGVRKIIFQKIRLKIRRGKFIVVVNQANKAALANISIFKKETFNGFTVNFLKFFLKDFDYMTTFYFNKLKTFIWRSTFNFMIK